MLSLPELLRYVIRHDRRTVTAFLTIFLRVVVQVLYERAHSAPPKALLRVVRLILASVSFPYYASLGGPATNDLSWAEN